MNSFNIKTTQINYIKIKIKKWVSQEIFEYKSLSFSYLLIENGIF